MHENRAIPQMPKLYPLHINKGLLYLYICLKRYSNPHKNGTCPNKTLETLELTLHLPS